jgi:hypothetical protein
VLDLQNLEGDGFSRPPSSARSARTTFSNSALALSRSQPVKSSARPDRARWHSSLSSEVTTLIDHPVSLSDGQVTGGATPKVITEVTNITGVSSPADFEGRSGFLKKVSPESRFSYSGCATKRPQTPWNRITRPASRRPFADGSGRSCSPARRPRG